MTPDFLDDLLTAGRRSAHEQQRIGRQHCARDGHQYQVHGKTNPTRLTCRRCNVSWAVGARTEPAEAAR